MAERVSLSPNFSIARISCLLLANEFSRAMGYLAYGHSQCIVLIHYRYNTHIQELGECVLCIQVLCPLDTRKL